MTRLDQAGGGEDRSPMCRQCSFTQLVDHRPDWKDQCAHRAGPPNNAVQFLRCTSIG
jgi:hypothetical protein